MREKPIIFSMDMVKAILNGHKTVTHRVIKPQLESTEMCLVMVCKDVQAPSGYSFFSDMIGTIPLKSPYKVGDLLWVRETYCHGSEWDDCKPSEVDPLCGGNDIWYFADGERPTEGWGKKRSSRFMPKWVTRIWLEVLDVRVERLQEITEEDAIKEGIDRLFTPEDVGKPGINDLGGWKNYLWHGCAKGKLMEGWEWQYSDYSLENPNGARLSFSSLWQLLNAKRGYGWDVNPWVWRYEFNVKQGSEDGRRQDAKKENNAI